MMPIDKMAELIERVERASGPDRELDVLIAQAVGFSVNGVTVDKLLSYSPHNTVEQIAIWASGDPTPFFILRYTASIDAAMMLVLEGAQWTLEPDSAWIRYIDNADDDGVGEVQCVLNGRGGKCTALALCAAALKARTPAATSEREG